MGIVSFHVDVRAEDGHAAIVVCGGIINQPLRDGADVVPELMAGLRVKRIDIVLRGNKHDAIDDDRSDFHGGGVARYAEDPLCSQVAHICRVNLAQRGVAPAAVVAVVVDPVVLYRGLKQGFPGHGEEADVA